MIDFLRIAGGQDRGFAAYYRNRTKMTFGWGLEFASHALGLLQVPKHPANHTTTPPATSLDARDFDNNGHLVCKTSWNAPQPIDLLSLC
jgi:hypothetical protein